jgi:GT2 family glycosyltransferase/tetratricopeptide (TPR) repeat protein
MLRFTLRANPITLGDRARDAREWDRAAKHYRIALGRKPDNAPIWVQYGHALKEAGKPRLAEAAYRRALASEPATADTHLQLGHVLKILGKTSEAEGAYLRAFVLEPSLPYPLPELVGLGWSEAQLSELRGMIPGTSLQTSSDGPSEATLDSSLPLGDEPHTPAPTEEPAMTWSGRFDPNYYLQCYPDVARAGMDPLDHFIRYGRKEGRKPFPVTPESRAVVQAEIRCLKTPSFGDEVALLVTHSPSGRLKPHLPHYIGSLRRQGISVVLIVAADRLFTAVAGTLMTEADGLFVRQNEGYDFAAWAHILRLHPKLFDVNILYLLNDSLFGPTNDAAFSHLLSRLRENPADHIGLTDNLERGWHISSYFLAFKPRALSSPTLRKFISDIVSYKEDAREAVIENYEIRLTPMLKAAGLRCQALFPAQDSLSPTIHHWKDLLRSGFPFIKMMAIRDRWPGVDVSDWRDVLAAEGYDAPLAERTLAEFAPPAGSPNSLADAKQKFRAQALAELDAFFARGGTIGLPSASEPIVSILLVVFNEAELTFRCLRSLAEIIGVPAEVIIVDNASSDETGRLLDRVKGAKIMRNSEDLHFLRAANQASAEAHGRVLLLINNDACLLPGALEAAIETIDSAVDVGAVGGKLILPDGTLQEAGSIIWNDGSCVGYGRGQDPNALEFQFRREVDYCSGAFMLLRRELFEQLGRFDTAFAPAYYEETDLCMRIRRAGYRIIYDPRIEVMHYEFASAAHPDEGFSLMRRNHTLFVDRHWRTLMKHHFPPDSPVLHARACDRHRPRLLVIEDLVPFPSNGAGFPRASRLLKALHSAGCFITYYSVNQPEAVWKEVYGIFPLEIEFVLGQGRGPLGDFLDARAGYYDVIVVCRPPNMEIFAKQFAEHPEQFRGIRIIYDAEALSSAREAMRLALSPTPLTPSERELQLRKELDLAWAADAVIAVSTSEASVFKAAGYTNVHVLGHALEPEPTEMDFEDRQDFLFVGALEGDYTPNTDGLFWFIETVMPYLDRFLGRSYRVHVAGTSGAPRLRSLVDPRVILLGRVDDLTDYYRQARVFIAPARFSAGIPHKLHETAARGLPAVTTSLLAGQVGWEDNVQLLVGDSPEEFAAQCARLYSDRSLWHKVREAALVRVSADCDPASFHRKLAAVLRSVGVYPAVADSLVA